MSRVESIKPLLQRARLHPVVATLLYAAAMPVQRAAHFTDEQIVRRIRRNGGSATYDGCRLIFPTNVGPGFLSLISWQGMDGYEPLVWRTLRELLVSAGTFIDIGAHIGLFGVLASKINPDCSVIAFEPVPGLADHCRKLFESNGTSAEIHDIALSDHDGTATFFLPVESTGYSSAGTLSTASWQARKDRQEITVKTAQLDTLLNGGTLKGPVVLKIDVEDAEAAALRGASKTISRYRPAIVCEILPRHSRPHTDMRPNEQHSNAETAEIIRELGYVPYAITGNGLFRFTDFAQPREFSDFLLLPEAVTSGRGFVASAAEFRV